MTDMLERIAEAQAIINGERDNLLKAMAALASHGHITIIPQNDNLTSKPVIVLPQRMYDRMLQIIPQKEDG